MTRNQGVALGLHLESLGSIRAKPSVHLRIVRAKRRLMELVSEIRAVEQQNAALAEWARLQAELLESRGVRFHNGTASVPDPVLEELERLKLDHPDEWGAAREHQAFLAEDVQLDLPALTEEEIGSIGSELTGHQVEALMQLIPSEGNTQDGTCKASA